MNKHYSIGELSVMSQIKAHTIRIWEQRYGLLTPIRSGGNTRYYSEQQLMKLLNVALLRKKGIKISQIAALSEKEIIDQASEHTKSGGAKETAIEQLMNASLHFDQSTLSNLFNLYIEEYGIEETFEDIVFPFLKIVGNLWVNGKITPGHEHFFSNMCKLKLFSVIDQLPLPSTSKPHILLALPEWDYHELGILYYYYLLKKAGYNCTYLGQAVPADDVIQTSKKVKTSYVICTFIGPTTEKEITNYVDSIIKELPDIHLYISGPHVVSIKNKQSKRLTIFWSMDTIIKKFNLKA
ncbi:MAG: MerR family transcriptional regulator [Prolixibacteraceae bacterium]|jgi:DNA-binding transcriptional MerR regulator/methylmalonyl-CoA mutase cobalamin-binding subunit|nr:MerR family transcriptional regulator [Prolixibacteraceae bacterium]